MKRDTVKYSHGLRRIWVHMSFKVKYCHEVFEHREIREACMEIFKEVAENYGIEIQSMGFDSNHVHFIPDFGKYSEPEIKKIFKGTSGRKILKKFPWLKKKHFWGSGLWGRQCYTYSIGSDMNSLKNYVRKQKFFTGMVHSNDQKRLSSFCQSE